MGNAIWKKYSIVVFYWNQHFNRRQPRRRRIALHIYVSFAVAFLRNRSGSAAAHRRRDYRPPLPPPSPARDAGDHPRLRRHLHLPARARHRQETAHRCRHLRPRRSRPHRVCIVLYLCCRQADERLPRRSRQHEEVSGRRLSAERALQLRYGLLDCGVAVDIAVGIEWLVPEPRRTWWCSSDDSVVQQSRARSLLRHLEHSAFHRRRPDVHRRRHHRRFARLALGILGAGDCRHRRRRDGLHAGSGSPAHTRITDGRGLAQRSLRQRTQARRERVSHATIDPENPCDLGARPIERDHLRHALRDQLLGRALPAGSARPTR